MDSYFLALTSALWLGILTSISPCPLATNIAAISYVSRHVDSPRIVLGGGLLYMLGRTLAYFVVALIVVGGISSIPSAANFLQKYMNATIGPILIFSGLLLLGLIPVPSIGSGISAGFQHRVERLGIFGAMLLGAVFALAFCPVSAALFFGSLIPLSLQHQSIFAMPTLYGIGTALPVAAFAFVLAFAANRLGNAFKFIGHLEKWMRRLTAIVFIIVGAYYSFNFTLQAFS